MLSYFCSLFLAVLVICPITAEEPKPTPKPLVLLLFGPSGSGQGVLSVKVSNALSIPHISSSDLVHEEVTQETEIGAKAREYLNTSGSIPDGLFLEMLYTRIKQPDCKTGFLLNTLPRTLEQAQELKKTLGSSHRFLALNICVSEATILNRLSARLVCQHCGRVYHKQLSPPKKAMICDHCKTLLSQRGDDTQENAQRKLKEYNATIAPVLAFYKEEELLKEINGDVPLEEILDLILKQVRLLP